MTATTDASAPRTTVLFVFGIVLIDMLGFGLVMPVLPGLIMGLAHVTVSVAAGWAGWLGAGYALMQFVCAPVIGNLSDRFGRRPVLLAAVLALGADYLLQALAPNFGWLIAGRLIAGITGASFGAAYAMIADVTPPERRAATFGLVSMAFGIGFVVGPALGGILGAIHPRLPFAVAAGLSLTNFGFGWLFLRESLGLEQRRPFDWRRANAVAALRALSGQSATVLWFVAALGAWQLAHIVYPAVWAYFAMAAYGFSPREVGIGLAMVGLSSALFQGVAMRPLVAWLGERRMVWLGIVAAVGIALLYALASARWEVWLAIALGGLQGGVQPSISALNSRAVDAKSQGELQGAVQSVGSIAAIFGPPLYAQALARFSGPGALVQFPGMPLLVSAGIALVALMLFAVGARGVPQSDK